LKEQGLTIKPLSIVSKHMDKVFNVKYAIFQFYVKQVVCREIKAYPLGGVILFGY